jgi:hypothetical protein
MKKFLEPTFLMINVFIALAQALYLALRFSYINAVVPFWYVKEWGESQLAPKFMLFLIPVICFFFAAAGNILSILAKKFYLRFGSEFVKFLVTSTNLILTYSLIRIIFVASVPFEPILSPQFLSLLWIGLVSFVVVYLTTPIFIEIAKQKGIITNPANHVHPGMILSRPSARGGGLIFVLGVMAANMFFVKPTTEIFGIMLAALLLGVVGFIDDYQNTHPKSRLGFFEIPSLRLAILFGVVLLMICFGVRIDYIGNPLGGLIRFDSLSFVINGLRIFPISMGITLIWVVWILNLLSWSNGIDGQYSGIIGIASLIVAFLALMILKN